MPAPTIASMITEDLGYCCVTFFFSRYKKTALVAARLGVSARAVRYAREADRLHPCVCEGREACMKKLLQPL